jgi:hypothetical protein
MPFAIAGAAGSAMLFIFTLIGTVVVAAYVVALAARCFLVVLQQTAAGIDRVLWPDEPMYDWLRDVFHLASLIAIWLVPAGMIARGLRKTWLPDEPVLRFLLLALPGLWLLVPFGLVSALSSESGWGFFRLTVLRRFARVFLSVLAFYVISAVLLVAAAALWVAALFPEEVPARLPTGAGVLPLAAALGAAILLIYARLLGRISWLSQKAEPARPAARPERRKRGRKKVKRQVASEFQDPWAVREEEKPEEDVPEPTGDTIPIAADELSNEPATEPPTFTSLDDDDAPLRLQPAEEVKAPRPPHPATEVSPLEKRLLERSEPEPPALTLFSGVYTFPWYETTLGSWFKLSLGGLALGIGIRGVIAYFPF